MQLYPINQCRKGHVSSAALQCKDTKEMNKFTNLSSLQNLGDCGLVTWIGFSCTLSARVCEGKTSLLESILKEICPDIN